MIDPIRQSPYAGWSRDTGDRRRTFENWAHENWQEQKAPKSPRPSGGIPLDELSFASVSWVELPPYSGPETIGELVEAAERQAAYRISFYDANVPHDEPGPGSHLDTQI